MIAIDSRDAKQDSRNSNVFVLKFWIMTLICRDLGPNP